MNPDDGSNGIAITIPTMLTIARLAVVPIIAILLWLPASVLSAQSAQLVAAVIFVLAVITDWFDGYLARSLKQTSAFGAFLDPVADKVIVCTTLVVLVEMARLHSAVAVIIISRELAVSALREWMAHIGESKVVAVAIAGKAKTAIQLIGIPLVIYNIKIGSLSTVAIGSALLWCAAALAVWSMLFYFLAASRRLRRSQADGQQQIGAKLV